jgi:hypothetical protein
MPGQVEDPIQVDSRVDSIPPAKKTNRVTTPCNDNYACNVCPAPGDKIRSKKLH